MFRKLFGRSKTKNNNHYFRKLHYEQFEERRMLAVMADVIFLVDESFSAVDPGTQQPLTHVWLANVVAQINLPQSLSSKGISNVNYGLVGFGELNNTFAHSQIVNNNVGATDPAALVGTALELQTAIPLLSEDGGIEDGWDAIEHVIAEYDFREGAVPVLVLMQNQEGRNWLNPSLTHPGILASLESKNVLLNTLTVGTGISTTPPIFDLSPYEVSSGEFNNTRILGVEADQADTIVDGLHDIYAFNATTGVPIANPPASEADALQISYKGSNTGATGMVGSGKSILISQQLTGGLGPSAAGYRAKSVPFGFEDISGTGTAIGAVPSKNIDISELSGFQFPFYGTNYDGDNTPGTDRGIWILRNGAIYFQDFSNAFDGKIVDLSQSGLTEERPDVPMIAALWDDLLSDSSDPSNPNQIYWEVVGTAGSGDQRLLVQWNLSEYNSGGETFDNDWITFQAVLYEDGRIVLNYQDLDSVASI